MAKTSSGADMPGEAAYDYIVVGSGAGGGPVAANLARAGFRVLLLEAGDEAESPNYSVPGFHPFATEDALYKWDYYVRHYADDERSRADPKFCPPEDGVLYPRASTLGGCTAHHALITLYPHDSDWDQIVELTGDKSWSAQNMRRYFQRLERNGHRPFARLLYRLTGWNIGWHGYDGWLPITMSSPTLLLSSPRLLRLILQAVLAAEGVLRPWLAGWLSRLLHIAFTFRDVNSWRPGGQSSGGTRLVPVSIVEGRRRGVREFINAVRRDHPDRLHVVLNALVTKILLQEGDGGGAFKALGVRYLRGERLYGAAAHPPEPPEPGAPIEVRCRREVIVSAGAFNTPQLLMLSGIGPRDELARHGIPVRIDRLGVGKNLQDRYEVGVVSRMKKPFALLEGARYRAPAPGEAPGPLYERWLDGKGPYATNGAVVSVTRRSDSSRLDPDLFCFGVVGGFRGYYPGYSQDAVDLPCFTWAILKGHTENRAGEVTLASSDPREPPRINFRYFDEGDGDYRRDLEAVVEGVRFCRALNEHCSDVIAEEILPGASVKSEEEIAQFVKDRAWGHHASCTCPIGRPEDPRAVVDSQFRVIGTQNLRIVDASVFPRIPGLFIVTPIYMIAEKAAEEIIAAARATPAGGM
jgi:choline dehydrogenase